MSSPVDLPGLYERRFAGDAAFRSSMWQILCRSFFQKYIDPGSTVVEVGAGHCEFINHIVAAQTDRRRSQQRHGQLRGSGRGGVDLRFL